MIERVVFDTSPIYAGEWRPLTAYSDVPLFVEVKCFITQPPPPGYKPCASCGSIATTSGAEVGIVADPVALQTGGRLDVTVSDASGDQRVFKLTVRARHSGTASLAVAGG